MWSQGIGVRGEGRGAHVKDSVWVRPCCIIRRGGLLPWGPWHPAPGGPAEAAPACPTPKARTGGPGADSGDQGAWCSNGHTPQTLTPRGPRHSRFITNGSALAAPPTFPPHTKWAKDDHTQASCGLTSGGVGDAPPLLVQRKERGKHTPGHPAWRLVLCETMHHNTQQPLPTAHPQ